jgi:hypothetical protein
MRVVLEIGHGSLQWQACFKKSDELCGCSGRRRHRSWHWRSASAKGGDETRLEAEYRIQLQAIGEMPGIVPVGGA